MPELIFRRSRLYDARLKRAEDFVMPDGKILDNKVDEFKRGWAQDGQKILSAISDTAKMLWFQKEIVCYITAGVVPYSDPLTLNLRSTIDTLTHELIHRILSEPQNRTQWEKIWAFIQKQYPEESPLTQTHIVVHAIHAHILKNLFGEERYQAEKNSMHSPDYIKAWEIVEKEGDSILAKLGEKE